MTESVAVFSPAIRYRSLQATSLVFFFIAGAILLSRVREEPVQT